MNPDIHAKNSAKKYKGIPEDYLKVWGNTRRLS